MVISLYTAMNFNILGAELQTRKPAKKQGLWLLYAEKYKVELAVMSLIIALYEQIKPKAKKKNLF